MFVIICEKCKNKIELTEENICDIVNGKEVVDITVYDDDITLTCFECFNSISTRE